MAPVVRLRRFLSCPGVPTLTELTYDRWREFDPEDAARFCALRRNKAGMINSSQNEILANGTDWRFVNEFERELKA